MKRFFAWITALLMLLSLAACSSTQTSTAAASQQASTSETGKSENELIAEENDILAANNALWEKVFASMDKNVTDTTLSSNYGDILMSALDHAKDQFTDEEYAALKADADKIREIETQIAALPQDEAASQSMTQTASTFPQFEGKDLDGNSVSSSLFADNAFTVVNFWFSGCKPCVDEMDDLNALNQRIQEQGGEVIGINTETLDGNADNIAAAKQILEQAEPLITEEHSAWDLGSKGFLAIQTCEDGYDYTLYHKDFTEIDGGQIDNPACFTRSCGMCLRKR